MAGNIHSIGMALQNAMRPEIARHEVCFEICGERTESFTASSPPIGQEHETESGLDLAVQERVFYFKISDIEAVGIERVGLDTPKIGWIIVDKCDDSRWKILPQSNEYAWRWHGQDRTAIKVITEQEQWQNQ